MSLEIPFPVLWFWDCVWKSVENTADSSVVNRQSYRTYLGIHQFFIWFSG